MAIENSGFIDFYLRMFVDSINVFDCRLSGVNVYEGRQCRCLSFLQQVVTSGDCDTETCYLSVSSG